MYFLCFYFYIAFLYLVQIFNILECKYTIFYYITIYADMAQLAEQLICNQQVIGSSPIVGSYGWIPEWPKGADCKSVAERFGGSNPPPSTS